MNRSDIEPALSESISKKGWIVRKVWPYIKDIIIDEIIKLLEKLKAK